jgi:hypothetical protein
VLDRSDRSCVGCAASRNKTSFSSVRRSPETAEGRDHLKDLPQQSAYTAKQCQTQLPRFT